MQLIQSFLTACFPDEVIHLDPITGDASFRRYFRFSVAQNSYILMDAPTPTEDCGRFVATQQAFAQAGLQVPRIIARDIEQGLLLLSDLGDTLLLSELTQETVSDFYRQALAQLAPVRTISATSTGPLPVFDQAFLLREMQIFMDWFVLEHLQLTLNEQEHLMLQKHFQLLADTALQQPQAGMHRDYHARNLMLQQDGSLAVIDFQDLVTGPVTYDAVSLLKDCYVKWPLELVQSLSQEFYHHLKATDELPAKVSAEQFQLWFDWMGLQRHIKVCGIFCRLYHRDGKSGYLADLPRVFEYVLEVTQHYPELQELDLWLRNKVQPALEAKT
ncbi:MAG: phosphotransferase [Gammaproteobacteria bacterium]|nr:phosphotransferase [Gammaproteobacteria bacterium]MBU2056981.1 phosphotransferase [Gammaproteobacteria bacterium]MBU2174487.1 phosphotransferase [Gammaproteobacteria bacterium]MBU2248179.1 phosphotransferase [Gammaproteobacteria bacterium]MBU2346461.1 phosphotransferase [Gammaproteobacteria bacterium]